MKVEVNKSENKNNKKKINETKSWFFENISKIERLLERLKKIKRKYTNN